MPVVRHPSSKILSAAHQVDTIVMGAGVIGLAVARAVRRKHGDVLVIDRANNIGTETSSRNSEVVHAGLYYPPLSLKGKLCVAGRNALYRYCETRAIPHSQCGKLVVAQTPQQRSMLHALEQQAMANGVYDTVMIATQDQIHGDFGETEIVARCGALYSPSTGIIDSHALMEQFRLDIEDPPTETNHTSLLSSSSVTGTGTIVLRTNVIGGYIDRSQNIHDDPYNIYVGTETTTHPKSRTGTDSDSYMEPNQGSHDHDSDECITTAQNDSDPQQPTWISCRRLINCSGLWASHVANYFHGPHDNDDDHDDTTTRTRIPWTVPRQYFCRGNYYKVATTASPSFRHLIYPVPDPSGSGLGIHATMDLSDQVKFGPDIEWLDPNLLCPDDIRMEPSTTRLGQFYEAIRTYWPHLPDDSLVPDYSGIRPKLVHPSSMGGGGDDDSTRQEDFRIVGPNVHGVPGLVHLFGMESPGLTSCLAIADYVVHLLDDTEKSKSRKSTIFVKEQKVNI